MLFIAIVRTDFHTNLWKYSSRCAPTPLIRQNDMRIWLKKAKGSFLGSQAPLRNATLLLQGKAFLYSRCHGPLHPKIYKASVFFFYKQPVFIEIK